MNSTQPSFRSPRAGLVLALASTLFLAPGFRAAQFEETTRAAGLLDSNAQSISAAWGDYNNDGLPDLFITAGWMQARTNFLYRNAGDGTFVKVGPEAGPIVTDARTSFGAFWVDFNNDGYRDLLLINDGWGTQGRSDLYWNHGDGTFGRGGAGELTTRIAGRSYGSCTDYDGDGWMDLCIIEGTVPNAPGQTQLYHATGHGTFTRHTLGTPAFMLNAVSWADYDNDGDPDLFVSAITDPSRLWRNDGRGQFTTDNLGLPTDGDTLHAAWADYDNDGDLDIALGSFANTRLYRNEGGARFVPDATLAGAYGFPTWADYDNDGHVDLLAAIGQVSPQKAALYHNNGDGTFTRVSEVFTEQADSWMGSAWGDYDNDGFLDVLLLHTGPRIRLYHNLKNANHWLKFTLIGTASNRDAIGAKVRVLATIGGQPVWQLRQVSGGEASQHDSRPHFGLGDATQAERVIIEWPSGNVQELRDQEVDRVLKITEPIRIQPPRPSASLNGAVTLNSGSASTYQWRFNGVDLTGETKPTLTLTNLQAAQQGRYSVVVTGTEGMPLTNHTFVFVDTQFTKITQGPVVQDTNSAWVCSWADYDEDGDIDLLVGAGVDTAQREFMGLFRNDGAAGFTQVAQKVGSLAATAGRYASGVWADYDNDGTLDCLVSDWTGSALLRLHRNLGNGTFELVTAPPLTDTPGAYGSWVDYDNDGWLDVFSIYGWPGGGFPNNYLFHATGSGRYARVTDGPLAQDRYLGVEAAAWGDYDGDGDMDLLVVDAGGFWGGQYSNYLYRNDGAGVFVRVTDNAIANDRSVSLMPVWADYDNDGKLDLFLSGWNELGRLFHNEGDGRFTQSLLGPGPETSNGSWGDFDNDGDLDLYVSRGQVNALTNLFYLNRGDGTFMPATIGSPVRDTGRSVCCLWGDYDNDGFLDLFVGNYLNGSDCLYHNNGNGNSWLKVRLIGTVSNRSAIGAKVRVYAWVQGRRRWQLRELTAGTRAQADLRAHFGLEQATMADIVRIEWPSGIVQELRKVPANQILTVTEPPALEALGEGRIRILCWARQNYELEVSDDLDTWTSLGVVATDVNRPVVLDPGAAQRPYRFYRTKGQ